MYTDVTFQDWERAPEQERPAMLAEIVTRYKLSPEFTRAMEAQQYFEGENPTVLSKYILRKGRYEYKTHDEHGNTVTRYADRTEHLTGAQVASNFLFRFVTQLNQYVLANGARIDKAPASDFLGHAFDKALEQIGEKALLHGVCWGFWNADHVEVIPAARDAYSGFVALVDEMSGLPRVGVQFWQIDATRPLHVRLFEEDGYSVYRREDGKLRLVQEKRPYKLIVASDSAGEMTVGAENYGALPVVPLYANSEHRSELSTAIKAKIDAYDRIASDFVDNLDQANDVYWVLNNFGGNTSEMLDMLRQVREYRMVANISDGTGSGSTAEPRSFEVPYNARQTALAILSRELYKDSMAMDMQELTGGSLTNVAIRTATANLNLKADRFEWQIFSFVQQLLRLSGHETEDIVFRRQTIANDSETVADIAIMRDYIDDRTALELNPYIPADQIDRILANLDAQRLTGFTGAEAANSAAGGGGADV